MTNKPHDGTDAGRWGGWAQAAKRGGDAASTLGAGLVVGAGGETRRGRRVQCAQHGHVLID
jgi:hypothetical protein